ncbi:MAG: ABC transporter ATP-binding protein [Bacteroidales bacterium]
MINITNLTFGYKKNKILFNNLNLKLEAGNIYGLFGMNGAGKTTLLKHISGLLFPQEGECLVFNQPSGDRTPEMLSNIFIIPEEFELPAMSAETYAKIHAPFYPRFDHFELKKHLEEFEVDTQKPLTTLSYGQKKKFLIAFGLAANTSLLLLDEPTNGLDIPSKSQFRRIIAASTNGDRCLLISTHQVRDLASIIDHAIIVDNGGIIFQKSVYEIADAFTFGKIKDGDVSDVVYSEEILGGKAAIRRNSGNDTQVDLELLFNAVIHNPATINNEFKS